MQAPEAGDQVVSGTEIQVIGVAEDDLGARLAYALLRQGLDRPLRADRHERRRLDGAVRGADRAGACGPVRGPRFERECRD